MKVVVLMGIEEDASAIRILLAKQSVVIFSEMDMKGMKPHPRTDERDNWFSHDSFAVYSHLFFVVVDANKAESLMKAVAAFGAPASPGSPLHAFQLNVEQYI